MTKPLVTVCVITYNHAPYIKECLNGILMQQTSFTFEIIINDDCSTDGTTEIIKEFEKKYPQIIKPIYHNENQYSKGVKGILYKFIYPKVKGSYIALCEGDDYWRDKFKLQKQVDILEKNPSVGVCYTNFSILYQRSGRIVENAADTFPSRYPMLYDSLENYIKSKGYVCPPSWVFRTHLLSTYELLPNACDGTFCLFSHFMSLSDIYYLHDITCVYRVLNNSASHSLDPMIEYQRRKDLHNLQLALLKKYGLLGEEKDSLYLNFYRQNILFYVENHMIEEIRCCLGQLTDLRIKELILLYIGSCRVGSKIIKSLHLIWKAVKGY